MASIFDNAQFPTLNDTMVDTLARQQMAARQVQPAAPPRNWFTAGVSAGVDQLQALSGRGVQAVGDAIASRPLADLGAGIAERNFQEAAANGRPDLEQRPAMENWTQYPAWLGYQAAKQLPNLAAALVASRLGGGRLAAMLPAEVAKTTGGRLAAGALAAAPTAYPQAVGSLYDEAVEAGNAGREKAVASLLGGVPYAVMEGFQPATLDRMLTKGLAGNILKRVGTAAAVGAATETVTEGVQTAMEQSFRPDLTPREKLSNIVEGAITGGAVGGLFGSFGGIRRLKTAQPSDIQNDDLKKTVDEQLKPEPPVAEPTGQFAMPGMEVRQRPTTGAQNFMGGAEPAPAAPASVREYTNFPLGGREGPFASTDTAMPPPPPPGAPQGPAIEGRRVYPENSVGTARWMRYSDVGGPTAAQLAAERAAQEGDATYDPRRQFEMFAADPASMPPSVRPSAVPPSRGEIKEELLSAGQKETLDLLGPELVKTPSGRALLEMPAENRADAAANIIRTINSYDETGKPVPAPLLEAGLKIGLMDEQGRPRDIAAELQKAVERNNLLWARAKETGLPQDAKKAQKFQNEKLKDLQAKATLVEAAQQSLAARAAATEVAAQQETAPAPKSAQESALTLREAPPVTPAPTFGQRFQTRGIAPTQGNVVEDVAPVAAAAPAAPIDRSGTQYQSLEDRLRGRVARPMQPDMPVQPSPQARVGEALGLTVPPEAGTQLVTKQDVAKAKRPRKRTQADVQAERANAAAAAVAPPSALGGGTSFQSQAPKPPTAATDIQIGSQREQIVRDLTRAKLERISQTDDVGRPMRQAASEALAALDTMQPGADQMANRVLGEHAVMTGDTVFSKRRLSERQPPLSDQAFDQALLKIAKSLPAAARKAIYPVNTAAELPAPVLEAAQQQNMDPREIRGVLYDGNVYIVKDQTSSEAELQEVIDHEVFGHGGARALLGDQRNAILSRVFKMAGGLEGLRSLARFYGVEKALNGYLPGRDLTEQDQVALTDELLAQAAGRATGRFKTFALAWVSRFKSGLINVLRAMGLNTAADRLDTFDAADLAEMMVRMREAVVQGNAMNGDGVEFLRATPQGMLESTKNIFASAENVYNWMDKVQQSGFRQKLNQLHLYTSSAGHIVDFFGKLFTYTDPVTGLEVNPLRNWWQANVTRGVAEQRFAHLVKVGYGKFEEVVQKAPQAAKDIGDLMKYTFYQIDPRKTWEAQPWLHGRKDSDNLRKHVTDAFRNYRRLKQNSPMAAAAYEAFIDTNEAMHFAQQGVSLYNLLMTDKDVTEQARQQLAKDIQDPMAKFLGDAATYNDPRAARDYWEGVTADLMKRTETYVRDQRGLLGLSDAQAQAKINRNTSTLEARIREIRAQQDAMRQAPYFHLGRFGEYVVAFHIKKDASGKQADPAAMDKVAERFHKAGIDGIEIPPDATRGNAYIRFETKAQMDAALKIAQELAKEGVVLDSGNQKIQHYDRRTEKTALDYDMSKSPAWADSLMDSIRAKEFGNTENMTESEQKVAKALNNEFERHVQQFFIDLLPDTAISKVMVHRNNVPGFSSDMVRSYLFRTQVGGRALANLYASSKMADARAQLTAAGFEARGERDTARSLMKQNVIQELFTRDAQRMQAVSQKNNWIDQWRAWNHAYFLGLSPSYAMVNLTQIGVLLWPELSKRFGFMNSARAIAKVTPTAIRLITAVLKEAHKQGGWRATPDASITLDVLNRPEFSKTLSEPQKAFIMRVVNSGILDIGSQSREIGRVVDGAEDSKSDAALRVAASFGYYTEMVSRLVGALAARELHGGTNSNEELFNYVDTTVRQSMLSYETWNQARATGRMGLAGQFTPVMTSFMQYTFQLTEKLYREFHDAFMNSDATSEQKAAARTFLGTHLAAIVTLTGTLGMPMASVFAAAFDKLADLFADDDDEPMNIKVAWRNLLAETFGKDVGEVIARGVPRAFGFDISSRAGEQDLLPYLQLFSKLLTDKRNWEDKVADDTFRMLGSPISMGSNIIAGGSKMMSGDIMGGMIDMVPAAIKGPLKAVELAADGYVDKKGNRMPNLTPGASDYIYQALGFNPAAKAENSEAANDQRILRGQMLDKAKRLRKDLAVALEKGDMETARELWAEAERFDAKNPNFQVLKTIESVIRARAREREESRRSGAPLGAKEELAAYTGYANTN